MANSSSPRWTEAQLRGIRTTGHSLLVSAAAGSGKTAMLAARCAHLVCDADDPCDVDQLLVVTFTEAAAAQMKARIHAALRDRVAAGESDRLRRQLALVDHASVSTLHSFCARLLREHFHAVGLDPAFSVLDGDEAGLLRREIARDLFDDRYEFDAGGEFQQFVDAYGEGDDARLIRLVIKTHELLGSLVDPQAWIEASRRRIAEAVDAPLEQSELGRELVRLLNRQLSDLSDRCQRSIELVRDLQNFPGHLRILEDLAKALRFWTETLANDGVDALAEEIRLAAENLPRLPPIKNGTPGKDLAKEAVDSVRDEIKKGSLRDLLRFTADQWQQGLRAIEPHAGVFLQLVEDFGKRYEQAKAASRVVDFTDLERLALRVLSVSVEGKLRPSAAARAYHERYRYVLVDEYQDINEVQDAILALLSRECVWDEAGGGNFFCVGDVKQSIYRFRLAEAARFLDRQKLFRSPGPRRRGEVIDLQSNFRSRGPLLEAINAVFERLMTESAADIEYDHTHRLQPGLSYPPAGDEGFTGAPIEMHLLPEDLSAGGEEESSEQPGELELDRSEREAVLVARRIRRLMGMDGSPAARVTEANSAGELAMRPIRFGDIVILLRSLKYKSEQYADVLRRAGIPVHAQSGSGYFDSTEVRDVLSLLSLLDNQRQDIPLAAVLRSPLANLPNAEDCFARARLAFPAEGESAVGFHDAVWRYAREKDDELAARLRDFFRQLEEWRELAHRRPLADLLHTVYEQSGYLAFCAGLHDGEQRVANLMDLQDRASRFGTFHRQSLSRFMQFLEGLRDEIDLGQPSTASEADDVVRVMSIHRSKGLEFPVVFLPDLGKRINFSDCQGSILADRTAGLGMAVIDEHRMIRYPSLTSVLVQNRLRQQALAEELRVLYVAMTRAREHLILVGTCKADAAAGWSTRWAGHRGAFPSDVILGAQNLLQWLGPTAAAAGPKIIDLTPHTAEDVASWEAAHARRPVLSERQERLARLEPLDPPPATDATAQQVIDRLTSRYPFAAFSRLAAAGAVTTLTKKLTPHAPPEGGNGETAHELPGPRFLSSRYTTPAEVGTATHLVLAHLDFCRKCDRSDLAEQIASMIDRKLIAAADAKAVDQSGLLWLMGSEIGELLKSHATDMRRELPTYFAVPDPSLPRSADPFDRVMVRGRIDVLLPGKSGTTLIDYKTDDIPASAVPFRARFYSEQIVAYRQAVLQITGKPVNATYLVFLRPRVIHSL